LEEKIAIIVLAAGGSSRFKKPKLLLQYNGITLVESAVKTALKSNIGPVITVTGHNADKLSGVLDQYSDRITIAKNKNWEKGVSTSIITGLKTIKSIFPKTYGTLIMLSDQPLITVDHLVNMIRSHFSSNKKIIASGYGGSFGVPAFFHKSLFKYFEKLKGDHGAKSIISRFKQDVHVVPNPNAELDIDTMEDYEKLLERTS
jgi:molybdenum cofactor cytidylyltransferase